MYTEIVQGVVDKARFEVWLLAHELTGGYDLVDDEAGLIGGELQPFFPGQFMDDDVEGFVGYLQTLLFGLAGEDLFVERERRPAYFDLVGKTAQEGWVHQVFGF